MLRFLSKLMTVLLVLTLASMCSAQSTVETHGELKVVENKLVNAAGEPVQLKGFGTHGLQWFGDFYENGIAIKAAAENWNVDIMRVTVYVYEGGYLDNPERSPEDFDKTIFKMVDQCIESGIYCIIDWHVHHPGFPSYYLPDAKEFFDKMAKRYAGVPNVMYEICNEPNRSGYKDIEGHDVTWSEIKEYANEVIPVIRKHSPNSVILVGTPSWSSLGLSTEGNWQDIADSPLEQDNIVYVLHFYAAGHKFHEAIDEAAAKLPIFVTEWAAASWKNDSENDPESAAKWLEVLNRHKIGWTYWNFAPGGSSYNAFKEGTKPVQADLDPNGPNVSETGKLVYGLISK